MAALRKRITVRLNDTDAAGILFFANQFVFAHMAYEDFLTTIGFPMRGIIEDEPFFIPIVHAEADYTRKLTVGDEIEVIVTIADIGESSYTLHYDLKNSDGDTVGSARTVHVTVDKGTQTKTPLPQELRRALEHFRSVKL